MDEKAVVDDDEAGEVTAITGSDCDTTSASPVVVVPEALEIGRAHV